MLDSENEPTSRIEMIQLPVVENAKAKHFPFMCAAFKINCWSIWRNILGLNMLKRPDTFDHFKVFKKTWDL